MEISEVSQDRDRRIRADEAEYRFLLHADLKQYFPDEKVFDSLSEEFDRLKSRDFKGFREETTRLELLEIIRSIQNQLSQAKSTMVESDEPQCVADISIFKTADPDKLNNAYFDTSNINIDIFESAAESISISAEIVERKNWSPEYTRKYLARVASFVFKSDLSHWPDKISASTIKFLLMRVDLSVHRLFTDMGTLSREYFLNSIKYRYSGELLPNVKDISKQSEEDLRKISEVKKLEGGEVAVRVLSSVRENSEYVRNKVIPTLLAMNYDSQSAFWEIHRGEFHVNPLESQMLASGTKSDIDGYVETKGGDDFYGKNIGRERQLDVNSGGFSHVAPKFLPELQARLFKKIDSLKSFTSNEEFVDFISEIDLIMYSLHLPFDGSGRTIEDFLVYLGEKFGYPLSFTVLGYREAGSPLLPTKEKVGPKIKKELNATILKRFGIDSAELSDNEAILLIRKKFSCKNSEAWVSWDAEKALFTSELISRLGVYENRDMYANLPVSFIELRSLWSEARTLGFITIPEKYKSKFDHITAKINDESSSEEETIVFNELDDLKSSKQKNIRRIAMILEAYALVIFGGYQDRNIADCLFAVFPDTPMVVRMALREGSKTTKLEARIKMITLGLDLG